MSVTDTNRYELMTHGVSGTPPENLLGTPRLSRLESSNDSMFFTYRDNSNPYRGRRIAYRWGQDRKSTRLNSSH